MLRLAVIALLLANAGYYAWSQGLLAEWGFAPVQEAEPQRLAQQIRPETLQVLRQRSSGSVSTPDTPAAAPTPAPAAPAAPASGDAAAPQASAASAPEATECLQAGVFDERQAQALRAAAAGLPVGSWSLEPTTVPGRWMIYMGKFADMDALDKKRAELRARNVPHDRAGTPALELGLSLGRFSSSEAAERELANLGNRGVRTARVVLERPESAGFTLRLPAVGDALRPQLDALRPAMAGKTLRTCG
ncbi:SPOR domain-containing protein [Acidovorax lacteus]|uniref:SPOR domain-containing protein n=1 Tax=Acidovorax lacteus TaxID=1924988 RepID=A0ABP8LDL4_9BURK